MAIRTRKGGEMGGGVKKSKLVKFPKKYKYGFRFVGDPLTWAWFWRFRYPLWILSPICWIKGHNKKIAWPFGIKIKYCTRCAQTFYKKRTTERVKLPFRKFYTKPLFSIIDLTTMSWEQIKETRKSGQLYLKSISPFGK